MARNPTNLTSNSSNSVPTTKNQLASQQKKSEFKKPSFYVNVATLIVIGIYTCFACNQVQETQTANLIAKKALSEANKPYVMFQGFTPHYSIENGVRRFRLGITWANLGNTPADFVRVFNCDPIVRTDLLEPEFHCKISESIEQTPIGIIGPKQPYPVSGPIIDESDMEATRNEAKAIYVFGYVTYQDSIDTDRFGNPEQRETRFCNRVGEPTVEKTTFPDNSTAAPAETTVVNPPPGAPITAIYGLGCRKFSCIDQTCKPLN